MGPCGLGVVPVGQLHLALLGRQLDSKHQRTVFIRKGGCQLSVDGLGERRKSEMKSPNVGASRGVCSRKI